MSVLKKITRTVEKLDLKTKAVTAQKSASKVAGKAARTAAVKAGELADKHGDKVAAGAGTLVDKAGKAVDKKTGGKYAHHIEKAKGAVVDGVAKGAVAVADTGKTVQAKAAQTAVSPVTPVPAAPVVAEPELVVDPTPVAPQNVTFTEPAATTPLPDEHHLPGEHTGTRTENH